MSIRLAKQLVYGAFYVVIWVLVIWGGYALLVHPAPPPIQPVSVTAQPISVLGVNVFASTPGNETFLAKVANINTNLAAQYFSFSFDLRDASGKIVESLPGASFLYGGEVKYVALVNQPVVNNAINNSVVNAWTLTISPATTEWVASSSFGAAPIFAIQNVATQINTSSILNSGSTSTAQNIAMPGIALVTGTLADNDAATFNSIFIVAIFKDANGNPVGASQTEIDSIAPNQTENFSVSYPAVAGIDPAATEVEAYAER